MNFNEAIILFIYPSRSRPQKFKEGLDSIKNNLSRPELATFVFTVDEDDPTLDQYLEIYKSNGVVYYGGTSNNKIHAVNRSMLHAPDKWDIVVVMSDDMFVVKQGFDNDIRNAFANNFPDGDGFLHYNDGYQKENVCTLSIVGRKYYERDKYIYDPNYVGLWCDVQATEMAYIRGKYKYMGDGNIIVRHIHPMTAQPHPVTGQVAQLDEQYQRDENMKRWGEDSIVLNAHRKNWYGIPPEERVNGFKYDKDEELRQREVVYRKEFGDEFIYPPPAKQAEPAHKPLASIVSKYAFGDEVWYVVGATIRHGVMAGITNSRFIKNEPADVNIWVEFFVGEELRCAPVSENYCFPTKEALIEHLMKE